MAHVFSWLTFLFLFFYFFVDKLNIALTYRKYTIRY